MEIAAVAFVVAIVFSVACMAWNRSSEPQSHALQRLLDRAHRGARESLFAVMVGASADRSYGWVMFVLVPFFTGFQATLALSRRKKINGWDAANVSALSVVLLGGFLIATAVEGFICILMAAPLALVLALLGGFLGLAASRLNRVESPVTFLLLRQPHSLWCDLRARSATARQRPFK